MVGLQVSKYLMVVSLQARCFTVSKASWNDSFHVKSVPFLKWRGAVKDESEGTNSDRYMTMLRNFLSWIGISWERHISNCTDLSRVKVCPILVIDTSKKVMDDCLITPFHHFTEGHVHKPLPSACGGVCHVLHHLCHG